MESLVTVLKGTALSIMATLILLLIFAVVLTFTNVGENTIPSVIIVTTSISLLIGSGIASRKIKKNGLINGAIIGAIYLISIYTISSIIRGGFDINLQSIIMLVAGIIFGILGGIIGINTKK